MGTLKLRAAVAQQTAGQPDAALWVNCTVESIAMVADLARSWLIRSAPVAAAQAVVRPLLALESTIIAHGMPYPENVRTAREVEALIRDLGAEPATIALIGGRKRARHHGGRRPQIHPALPRVGARIDNRHRPLDHVQHRQIGRRADLQRAVFRDAANHAHRRDRGHTVFNLLKPPIHSVSGL
jgi:Indigoidine synthase A like protein